MSKLLKLFALLVCVLALPAWRLGAPISFYEDADGIATGIARLAADGAIARAVSIRIQPDEIYIEAQDPQKRRHINGWRLVRSTAFKRLNWDTVRGPEPVQPNLINPNLDENLFDLADIDFTAAGALMKASVERAALEDAARVTSMEIRRQLFLLPQPASRDVRWIVNVGSGRETASIQADAKGRIVGVDLSGTNRAKTFDLLSDLSHLPVAQRQFAETVGPGELLTKVRFNARGIAFDTTLEEKLTLLTHTKVHQVFRWDLNGLTRVMGSINTRHYFGAQPPFAVGDADWTQVGDITQRAKAALQMPEATLYEIELSKPADHPGAPRLEWKVVLADGAGEQGTARLDTAGTVLGVVPPKSRRVAYDGRDPARWAKALAQIEATFGADGSLAELILYRDHIKVVAADPQRPADLAQFLLNDEGFKRFGSASPFDAANARFSMAELTALSEPQMRKLQKATTSRLGLPLPSITTITIGRASMDPSPHGNVTVEIRAEESPFGRGGRVNWEIDGREIKAYLP